MISFLVITWLGSSLTTGVIMADSLRHVKRCGPGEIGFFVLLDLIIKAAAVAGYLKVLGVL